MAMEDRPMKRGAAKLRAMGRDAYCVAEISARKLRWIISPSKPLAMSVVAVLAPASRRSRTQGSLPARALTFRAVSFLCERGAY